jgi:hypothetical protein
MKRLMLSSLSVLLLCVATVPAVKAETAALNPTTLRSSSTTQLTPFNLVHLAWLLPRTGHSQLPHPRHGLPLWAN